MTMTALHPDAIRRAIKMLEAQPMPDDNRELLWHCVHCEQVTLLQFMPCCDTVRNHWREACDKPTC